MTTTNEAPAGAVRAVPDTDPRAEVQALVAAQGWSRADVARRVGLSDSTVSLWMRDEYRGDNARIDTLMRRWLDTERDVSAVRAAGLDRHADLAVTGQIDRVLRHAHGNADLVVVYGAAGAGKTWALRRYVAEHTGAWVTSMSPAMTTPAAVLARIAQALDVGAVETTAARLERAVIDRLAIGPALVVVDEAHHLSTALLDVVRCVYDEAGCGLALAGNEPLWSRLASGDRAAQIVSRVGVACRLRRPAEADVLELAATLLGEPVAAGGRKAVLAAGRGLGGLRAVRKLVGQAHILAAGDGRDRTGSADVADAAELLGATA